MNLAAIVAALMTQRYRDCAGADMATTGRIVMAIGTGPIIGAGGSLLPKDQNGRPPAGPDFCLPQNLHKPQ